MVGIMLVLMMTLVMLVRSLVIRRRLVLWRVGWGMTMVDRRQRSCVMLGTTVLRRDGRMAKRWLVLVVMVFALVLQGWRLPLL